MGIAVCEHVIGRETRNTISKRYHRITRAVNSAFWNSVSDTEHSFYVGSYGRGTAIDTSDIDVLVELPVEEFIHYNHQCVNGQSRLLQVVKKAIQEPYPLSDVKGDGQVVVVDFSDGIKFEILPAFRNVWSGFGYMNSSYIYPNTHMGGNWLSTNPKKEIEAMDSRDKVSRGLLKATCEHIRFIRDNYFYSYRKRLSGILIDSFVYCAIKDWHYIGKYERREYCSQSYEEHLLYEYNALSFYGIVVPEIRAPGSENVVDATAGWELLGKILQKMV